MIRSDYKPGQAGFEAMGARLYRDAWGLVDDIMTVNEHNACGVYVPHVRYDVNNDGHIRIWPGGAVVTMRQEGGLQRVDTSGVDPRRFLEIRKKSAPQGNEGLSLTMFTGLDYDVTSHELFYPHQHPEFANVAANVVAAARAFAVPKALSIARAA